MSNWISIDTTLDRATPRIWRAGEFLQLVKWLSQGFLTVFGKKTQAETITELYTYSGEGLSITDYLNDKYDPTERRLFFTQDIATFELRLVVPSDLIDALDKPLIAQYIKNRIRAGIVLGDVTYAYFAIACDISGTNYAISMEHFGVDFTISTNYIPI
jgi:hypothetical protein